MSAKNRFVTLISLLLLAGFLATSLVSYSVSVTLLKRGLADSILPLTSDNIYSEIQKDLIRPIFIASMMASDTFLRDWVLGGEQDVDRLTRYLAEVKSKYQTIASFFVSDRSANYYYGGGILKQVRPDEPRDAWYYRVRALHEPYELNVDRDMANSDAKSKVMILLTDGVHNAGEIDPLTAAGVTTHVIGGADLAAELDAKRAIRQGTEVAAGLP